MKYTVICGRNNCYYVSNVKLVSFLLVFIIINVSRHINILRSIYVAVIAIA